VCRGYLFILLGWSKMKMNETCGVRHLIFPTSVLLVLAVVAVALLATDGTVFAQHRLHGQQEKVDRNHPWMNASLSPDQRAEMVLKEMTLDEKIGLLHGMGMPGWPRNVQDPQPELGNGGAGFVLGVPRLGIPIIQMSDAAYGVRSSGENGRYSTALPAPVGAAASWDTEAACAYGALIGRELRAQGYNMTLGGGVNITREPRNGRTFEYLGEDPILAGTLVGNLMKCEQAQHVLGDIKHYAVNDQESGRNEVDAIIGKRALRESDLLAFEIGVGIADPSAVMCSYNSVNGDFACENKYLLTDVLKKEWGFKGFVVSDWGGTHSTVKASAAGRIFWRQAEGGGGGGQSLGGRAGRARPARAALGVCEWNCGPPDAEECGGCGGRPRNGAKD
jgi:beta-glucosidase